MKETKCLVKKCFQFVKRPLKCKQPTRTFKAEVAIKALTTDESSPKYLNRVTTLTFEPPDI